MMKGVFLDTDTLAPADLDLGPLQRLPIDWTYHGLTDASQTAAHIAGAEIVVSNKVVLDATLIRAAARHQDGLRLIAIAATGTNNLDLEAARACQVAVTNVPGYATDTVAQHCFALLLALATQLLPYAAAVRRGDWSANPFFCLLDYPIQELSGKTLVILGYGNIGRKVAGIAQALGMQVLVARSLDPERASADPRPPLEELLPLTDVLSLHCPLTPQTQQLINAERLALMRPNALLINTARGGLIDENALLQALRQGRIAGAALDTLAVEPPPADHPLLRAGLDNLIITPHCAWASRNARQRIINELGANIGAFLAGAQRQRLV